MRLPLLALILVGGLLLDGAPVSGTALEGRAEEDHIDVIAESGGTEGGTHPAANGAPLVETMRIPQCRRSLSVSTDLFPCPGDDVLPSPECEAAGVATLPPVWRRTRADAASAWTDWTMTQPASCAAAATITPEMVLAELRRMTLTPSRLTVQPDRGWVLVNKPTVVYADVADQVLTTTILGAAVTVTAHPAAFRWDFGDGTVTSTTSPGHPWPNHDVAHPYPRTGTYAISLTTTWSATFTVAGDPTVREVPGTASTASSSAPFVAQELRSHLVGETCSQQPHSPGCD